MSRDTEEIPVYQDTVKKVAPPSDTVHLAVGVGELGSRFTEVIVDEMCGVDDHLLTGKKSGGNAGKGMSLVLSRCIQAIPGFLAQKADPMGLFDRELPRRMYQVDRDILIVRIQFMSGNETGIMAGICPRCSTPYEEEVNLAELPIILWPKNKPAELPFTLSRGIFEKADGESEARWHKDGILRFPTGADQEAVAALDDEPAAAMDGMLSACIIKLGGLTSLDTAQVRKLSSTDRRSLMQVFKNDLPGIRQWKEVTCTCRRKFDITMDIAAFFEGQRK